MSAASSRPGLATASWVSSPRAFIAPLALAQFICSFAGSNMNVMINDISRDLHTDVKGVQTTITLFLLIMAVLMIPCSKLTDRWGRKRCFTGGLILYGIGALLSAVAPGLGRAHPRQLGVRGRGDRLLDPACLHPHHDGVHLTRIARQGVRGDQRDGGYRRRCGAVDRGSDHLGASAGGRRSSSRPVVSRSIIVLSRRVVDPLAPDPKRPFDAVGALLSAVGCSAWCSGSSRRATTTPC